MKVHYFYSLILSIYNELVLESFMLNKINEVSVFVADFASEQEFNDYLQEYFTDEGDMYSELMKDLNVDFIDCQFQETIFTGRKLQKEDFKDFSYYENFYDLILNDVSSYNSIILLYNFNASDTDCSKIKLLGVYNYK